MGTVLIDLFQVRLVLHDPGGLLPDGAEGFHHGFPHGGLELAIALARELGFDFRKALAGDRGVYGHQVGNTGLVLLIVADAVLRIGIGDGPLELAHNGLGGIHQQHTARILIFGFAHLGGGVCQAHDPGTHLGHEGLGDLEHVAVNAVEAAGNGMAQLHVLLLILAHRHQIRLVQQNVRRHQAGVREQAAVDIVRILGGLVLELGHPAQLAEHGIALQHPAQLRVLVHMALDEKGILLRVQAAGDVLGQLLQGTPPQIRRVLPDGDGVKVCHKVEAVIFLCPLGPVFHGT